MSRSTIWQFSKYIFVGVLGAVVDLGVFLLLTRFINISVVPANLISVFVGVLHNFVWHKFFTFKIRSAIRMPRELGKFLIISGVAYMIQQIALPLTLLLPGEVMFGSKEDVVVKAIIIGVVGVTSYFFNRAWTFRTQSQGTSHQQGRELT